jgi:hypothetical protein
MVRIDISRIEELALAIQEEMAEDDGVDLIAFHCEFMRMERELGVLRRQVDLMMRIFEGDEKRDQPGD